MNTVFAFNYVNTKLLLIASAWAESLSGRFREGHMQVKGFIKPDIIPSSVTLYVSEKIDVGYC